MRALLHPTSLEISTIMTKQEGVIKFRLEYTPAPPLSPSLLEELDQWRQTLFDRGLIGQNPDRYGGFGYGNISRRIPELERGPDRRIFAISGTQTGHLARLAPEQYAVVLACFPAENRIVASGPIRPSSESMTHGILYELDDTIRFVMHAHSPKIWHAAASLALPVTDASVPYGTPEMAQEVRRLFAQTDCRARGIFSMGGHEDGIVSFGPTAQVAGQVLLNALAQAGDA
jgi:hypothetical protein